MESNEKQEIVARHERRFAGELTESVLEKPELSVWMILIPFLFIVFMQRQQKFKQLGDTFLRGLLYTKNHALEAAARLVAGVSAQTVEEETACKVRKNPDADTLLQQVYQAQLSEITLLTEHYRRLLSTQAADYAAMVREAYRPGVFQLFLVELAQRERLVNEAAVALNSEPDMTWRDVIKRLEEETILRRKKEADQIFSCNRE